MRGLVARLLTTLTGVAMLVVYLLFALVAYDLAGFLWRNRPDPAVAASAVVVVSLCLGYLSYRAGTARLVAALDAERLRRERVPEFYRWLDGLASDFDVDTPDVYVSHIGSPNALALGGPADGFVVLDASLFRLLSRPELEGVVAHELAHLAGRDTLVKTLGYSVVNTVAGVLFFALMPAILLAGGVARALASIGGARPAGIDSATARGRAVVASLAVGLLFALTLVLRAHSRHREYAADARAVRATGRPLALASALDRIQRASVPDGPLSRFYIHGDEEGTLSRLFATHPPMDDRVRRLRSMADAGSRTDDGTVLVPVR